MWRGIYALKLLAFADFHDSPSSVEKALSIALTEGPNLIAVAGDLAHNSVERASDYLRVLARSNIQVLYVPGNMDSPALANDVNLRFVKCIHGKCECYDDFAFIGLGGAAKGPFFTPFEYTESYATSILEGSFKGCPKKEKLVLISHCPPKDTKVDKTHAGIHAGSISLRRFIEERKPVLVVCAHVHEARGIDAIGDTLILNTGPSKSGYYAVIELEGKPQVKLCKY
jgi:Icc-related predicted phosphoesterase